MKKISKVLIVLSIFTSFTMTSIVNTKAMDKENEEIVVEVKHYTKDGQIRPQTRGVVVPDGAIDVVTILKPASAISKVGLKKGKYDSIKNSSITVLSNVPKVGVVTEIISVLVNEMERKYGTYNYTRDVTIETRQSYRDTIKQVKMYNNSNWILIGQSLSRYYYEHLYMTSYDSKAGDFKTDTLDKTHSNGYAPAYKALAKNFNNESQLIDYSYTTYKSSGNVYFESY